MRRHQRERDEFIARMTAEGVSIGTAARLMRHATTLHRLAELECSSEAADRDRVFCPGGLTLTRQAGACLCRDYGSYDETAGKHGTVPRIAVQDEHTQRRVEGLCARLPHKWRVVNTWNGGAGGRKIVFVGESHDACFKWIHDNTPFSFDEATKRQGYEVEEVPGLVPVFSGDPRGAVLKLQVPSGKTDDWGGTGVCVP